MTLWHFSYLSWFKQILAGMVVLLGIVFSCYAASVAELSEQAKTSYFSGNFETAVNEFLPLAQGGDADSQYYLALIYLTDGWSGKNMEKGLAYLLSAADQSHAAAMWKLGALHEDGAGVERDLLLATDWYRRSARIQEINTTTQFMKITEDDVLRQSSTDVITETTKLAKQNDIDAQVRMANIYDAGQLTEQDIDKAFHWYHAAAKKGNTYAMFMTGYYYCRGLGVGVNKKEADRWLMKSGRAVTCN